MGKECSLLVSFCLFLNLPFVAAEDGAKGEGYFHDDTVPTFFRRIAWSPDGNLLVCPTGKVGENNSTFLFARAALPYAVLELPVGSFDVQCVSCTDNTLQCGKFPSVCVRFSPILYNLVPDVEPLFDLPYRMVYAVGKWPFVPLTNSVFNVLFVQVRPTRQF